MDRIAQISRWLAREGRLLSGNLEVFQQFTEQVVGLGVPLDRSWQQLRALHPRPG